MLTLKVTHEYPSVRVGTDEIPRLEAAGLAFVARVSP